MTRQHEHRFPFANRFEATLRVTPVVLFGLLAAIRERLACALADCAKDRDLISE